MQSDMNRLGVKELTVGMKVQWSKGGKTKPEVLEIVSVEKSSPRGKTRVRLKDQAGGISLNYNPGNRYVRAS